MNTLIKLFLVIKSTIDVAVGRLEAKLVDSRSRLETGEGPAAFVLIIIGVIAICAIIIVAVTAFINSKVQEIK